MKSCFRRDVLAQRFYFDLHNGHDFIRDDEGVEASNLEQATVEAQVVMEEMRESDELSSRGRLELGDPG